jgi:PGAP1-like protein
MRVIGIHGIGHDYMGANRIKQEWLLAIQDGLGEAGFPQIAEAEFAIAAYGALFRPSETRAGTLPRLTAEDVQDEWETSLLLEWWKEAARLSKANRNQRDPHGEDPSIQSPDFAGRGRAPVLVQRALNQLSKSRFFNTLGGERAVLFLLKQVRDYLHKPEMKQAIQQRVIEKVTAETRVIIGHSLGSVIAYECLCAHPEWNVQTFITLGSPLGISPLIFDTLIPQPQMGKGVYPNVRHWFNIADQGDIIALEKKLAPKFGFVIDQLVYNGWNSHLATRYLNAKETGDAIATGLFDS